MDSKTRLNELCRIQLKEKNLTQYAKRLEDELYEIEAQGEFDYLLDLHDKGTCFASNENNLIVAYLLGITPDWNPDQEFNFVQGEFPDVDIDYLTEVRDHLKKNWAPKRFGEENICSIGTYGTLGIKSAMLDMAKIYGYDKQEIQAITVRMEDKDDDGNLLEWDKAIEIYPDFKAYCDSHPKVAEAAQMLIDRNRSGGVHAGGLIIANCPISDFVPLEVRSVKKDQPKGVVVSAWSEGQATQDLQPVGLIKFDLLVVSGLKQYGLPAEMIKKRHGLTGINNHEGQPNWTNIDYLNDPKAIEMANRADLKAIFQFDSEGIRKMVKSGGVTGFDDIPVYSSLYRPSTLSMKMDKTFCDRKQGREQYEIHPMMEPILGRTYGVMCIHENALISTNHGHKPIKNIKINDKIWSVNEKNKVELKECHGCGPTRKEDGYKMTLENGKSVILTGDHKVLTYHGMKEVKDLSDDELIACSYNIPIKQNKNFDKCVKWLGDPVKVAYLLGLMTGDASIPKNRSVSLCCGSELNCDKIIEWIKLNLPKLSLNKYFHCRSWYITIFSKELSGKGSHNRKTKWHNMLDALNMKKSCLHKCIPDQIFHGSKKIRTAFISGLIDADGCSSDKVLNITSASKALIQDVMRILSSLNVVHTLLGDENRIYIWSNAKIFNHYTVIKDVSIKYKAHNIGRFLNSDINKLAKEQGISVRRFCLNHKIERSGLKCKFGFYNKGLRCGINFGDLRYFKIKSKEIISNQQFYGMSVSDNHNLFANGIVVKNCYQEQVMQILNVVGEIPMIHCEKLRKAISKKKEKEFAAYKEQFLQNGKKNLGVDDAYMENLWQQVEAFSGYGFNKCVIIGTLIPHKYGVKEIQDFQSGDQVYCINSNGNRVLTDVVQVHDHGILPAFEVTFEDGYQITCTINHKFLTEKGQIPLKAIIGTHFSIMCDQAIGEQYARTKKNVERGMLETQEHYVAETEYAMFPFFNGQDEAGCMGLDASHVPIADTGRLVSRNIVRVRYVGKRRMFDLEVANPTHNFILPNGVVTSNSHAYAYGYIAARHLWLKAHYPLEFWCAVLMCEKDSAKIKEYKIDAKRQGIEVEGLDINKSKEDFSIGDDNKIYYGFGKVKGIGADIAAKIVAGQPYSSLGDFLTRFGTDSKVLKPLVALGCFKETEDRVLLYKFYDFYKEYQKKRNERQKRHQDSLNKYQTQLEGLLNIYIEDKRLVEELSSFDARDRWEYALNGATMRIGSSTKNGIKYKDVLVYDELMKLFAKRAGSIKTFKERELFDENRPLDMKDFNPNKYMIDRETEKLMLDKKIAESEFYGFNWVHDLEESPNYTGLTFEDFEQSQQAKGPVEVKVLKAPKLNTSKKGVNYWSMETEDATGRKGWITIWEDDYERFSDELRKDNMLRIWVTPPFGNFSSYSMFAPRKHERARMVAKNKADDYRLFEMKKKEVIKANKVEKQIDFEII